LEDSLKYIKLVLDNIYFNIFILYSINIFFKKDPLIFMNSKYIIFSMYIKNELLYMDKKNSKKCKNYIHISISYNKAFSYQWLIQSVIYL